MHWINEASYAQPVIGVDEVGRGPWAGPVVAAAVCLDGMHREHQRVTEPWSWVQDSKKVTPQRREKLYDWFTASPGVLWSIGVASVEEIDKINIRQATLCAMQRACMGLHLNKGTILVDGRDQVPDTGILSIPFIRGDQRCFSIAVASILAKVYRDRLMDQLHEEYPMYRWQHNRGYGTAAHHQAMQAYGITPHHRRSFRPVREVAQHFRLYIDAPR